MTKEKKDDVNFETGMARLEELLDNLEQGELNLDQSLTAFEEGVKLTRRLNKKLDEAEKKLELLLKDEDGNPASRDISLDMEPEEEGGAE